jgi:hypothetical protein
MTYSYLIYEYVFNKLIVYLISVCNEGAVINSESKALV